MNKPRGNVLARLALTAGFVAAGWLSAARSAQAHVKWFSRIDWSTPPRSVADLARDHVFWLMLALAVVVLLVFVLVESRVSNLRWMQRAGNWFERQSGSSLLVMRVGAFAAILIAWHDGSLFAPDLVVNNAAIERLQLAIIILLLWTPTTALAGVGLAALWTYGAARYGLLHMLDYVNVLGAAYFLTVRPLASPLVRATALPVLYASVGFSLIWLGCEKLVYPQWALFLLQQRPMLSLGMPPDFFLTAAAFVELGLGFMLMIGLFGRPLSILATLLFFATTIVFGKVEVIGHTLIHAALIVFLLEGPGHTFTPPAALHRTLGLRLAFAGVNFVLVVFAALFAYSFAAAQVEHSVAAAERRSAFEVAPTEAAPTLILEARADAGGGWNVRITTTNFHFAPDKAGAAHVAGEGHVALSIDGRPIARAYGEWHYLPPLSPGEHTIRATLTTNDGKDYTIGGLPITASATLRQEQ
jgi:uncharacterized membrane protein YphA (DoxX/SURF4 family)